MSQVDPVVLSRSIVRIPVANQPQNLARGSVPPPFGEQPLPPNNTLVFVRAWLPEWDESEAYAPGGFQSFTFGDDTDLIRRKLSFESLLYAIDQYKQVHAKEYVRNTEISVTAFLSTVDADKDETGFTCAVDSVEAEIVELTGQLKVTVTLAEQESDPEVELRMAIFISAWILTYEPREPLLPRPLTDAVITDHVALGHDTSQLVGERTLMASSAVRKRKIRAAKRATQIMSYDEMVRADPIPATERMPSFETPHQPQLFIESADEPKILVRSERVAADQPLWQVHLESAAGRVHAGMAGKEQSQLGRGALRHTLAHVQASEPYCPPWLSTVFFPRVAPRRIDVRADLVGGLSFGGVHTLSNEQLTRDWPWCTIGRVFFSRKGTNFAREHAGTGVLVGRNLLLTASHVAPWGQPPGNWWMEFVPAYAYGESEQRFGSSYVESFRGVRNNGDNADGLDVVICKLYKPLGDRCGWMGYQWWEDEDPYYAGEWTSVGYPQSFQGGERPAVEFARGIKDIDDDEDGLALETVAFTDHGWSGGPLWGWFDGSDPRVIGVNSGRELNLGPDRSVFAGGHHMGNLITWGKANYS